MNNEDFITIRKIDKHSDVQSDKVIVSIMDLTAMQSNITNTPPPSMQRQQHTINISKDYIEKDILKEFIDKVVEILEETDSGIDDIMENIEGLIDISEIIEALKDAKKDSSLVQKLEEVIYIDKLI